MSIENDGVNLCALAERNVYSKMAVIEHGIRPTLAT